MRFILNFIFYGILFYLIYLVFPDAFFTMVSWAHGITEFIKELYLQLVEKIREWRGQSSGTTPPQQALMFLTMWMSRLKTKF